MMYIYHKFKIWRNDEADIIIFDPRGRLGDCPRTLSGDGRLAKSMANTLCTC